MSRPLDAAPPVLANKKRAFVFLRWIVIITTSYLLLFDGPIAATDPRILGFVAVFLLTNLGGAMLPARYYETTWLRAGFVVFDALWISFGMYLAGEHQSELFLLYFSVLFLAALGESEGMIAIGCGLIALFYTLFLLRTEPADEILRPRILLRFPFLFGIGTFYGYLVAVAKRERQMATIANERERCRTDLLATLTHDLQTPLSSIAALADLLLAEPQAFDAAERRGALDSIKKAALEGSELVGTFLAMAAAEVSTKRQLVDLNEVAREVLEHHCRAALDKEVRLGIRLAERLPPIAGDRSHLRRAIGNLVWNGVKFVPPGGSVELATGFDGAAVIMTVSDDGPGIPDAMRSRLFEPYVSEGEQAGTGLGLFMVRLIAEAHGGAATANSLAGRGSRFTLRFPIPADVPTSAASGVRAA